MRIESCESLIERRVTAGGRQRSAASGAAALGGVASSVSGASESGVARGIGHGARVGRAVDAGCASSGGGVCVRSTGGAGSGGAVGKYERTALSATAERATECATGGMVKAATMRGGVTARTEIRLA